MQVMKVRDMLQDKVGSLQQDLATNAPPPVVPPLTSCGDSLLPFTLIDDFRDRTNVDLIRMLKGEVTRLNSLLEQVIARAAVCLDVHVERARTLLLLDSQEQFELYRHVVSTPKKAGRFPLPSLSIRSNEMSETDLSRVDEDTNDTDILPVLPLYKASTAPGREQYLEAMHALLMDCVRRGDLDRARYVLSSCPRIISMKTTDDIDQHGGGEDKNIVHIVCEQQLYEFVDLFLQYNPDMDAQTGDGKSYLHLVSDSKIVEMLCTEGTDPNLTDKSGQTPLHLYVAHKLYDCASAIAKWGADPNIEDWRSRKSPLQSAAAMGDYRLLRILLTETIVPPKIDKSDFDGNTLLHLVCMTEAPGSQVHKCIMLLLDRGASPRAVNIRGITPLHFIAGNQYLWHSSETSKEEVLQLVQLLLTLSVDVNAKDVDGCTALVVACAHRKFELCQILLQHKADMNIPCSMNSYLLRRGNHSEEEHQVDGLDCTASDLFPPGRRRSEIFAYINSKQSPVDLESRNRCMNCADSLKSGFFSRAKTNCGMCGRVVCEECVSKQHVVKSDRAPPFVANSDGESVVEVCIVCGPILAENYPAALRESPGNGSKGFLNW